MKSHMLNWNFNSIEKVRIGLKTIDEKAELEKCYL